MIWYGTVLVAWNLELILITFPVFINYLSPIERTGIMCKEMTMVLFVQLSDPNQFWPVVQTLAKGKQ